MNKIKLAVSSALVLGFICVYTFTSENKPAEIPTDKKSSGIPIPTQLNDRMANEKEFEEMKEAYLNLIHGNGAYDWRAINAQNFRDKMERHQQMLGSRAVSSYANGAIAGEWFERGSNDQAGNVRVTAFDALTENIYAIGDGGILFKGSLTGANWQSLNDHFILDKDVLEVIYLADGTLRIFSTIGNGVWYSDDEGLTWTASTGFIGSTWDGDGIDLIQLNDADSTIAYLYTYMSVAGNGQNKLAYSKDHGVSFTIEHTFGSANANFASMCSPHESSIAYILDNDDDVWVFEDDQVTQIADALALEGGTTCQIEVTTSLTDTILYILMDSEFLYVSNDAGYTFTQLPDLPIQSWDVGIGTSIDNPNAVYFGEMELWRSVNGGNSFTKVSDWWEYYNDVPNKIHADIMNLQAFKRTNGQEFTLIPNHGGINISYDNLATTPNITLLDMNVGQFYDIATSPINSDFIFGGTQDQGLLRTWVGTNVGTVGFEQVISGDYGQQQFSNNGQSFWTQYPGADFSYYANAMTDPGPAYWYNIDGTDMPSAGWIVPTGAAPNASDDYILVGGGNISGGSGSYLIKLQNTGSTANATQFSFDFKAASGRPIAAIETTPLSPNKWYVSTENGRFYHSEDAGANWTEANGIVGPGSSWLYSSDIYASRLTPGLVFLGGTNYWSTPAYMSIDGGINFVPLDNGDLPNTMIHELCMDPQENFLFAATDAGAYVYDMNQGEWFDLGGTDAAMQEYISVEFVAADNVVRFATWGRGIWDFKMADVTGINEEVTTNTIGNSVYPIPSTGVVNIQRNTFSKAKLFNIQGQEVMEMALQPGVNEMNLSFLKTGTYLLVGMDQYGAIWKEKIVISH